LRFSRLTFLLGVLYERTIEKRFPALRGVIVGIAGKYYAPRQLRPADHKTGKGVQL
jgi:hypothetical protein